MTSLFSQATAPGEILRRLGNLPARSRRQIVVRLRPVIALTWGQRRKESFIIALRAKLTLCILPMKVI
jgi:hypothetical protein